MSTWQFVAALVAAYTIHCLAVTCEAALAESPHPVCHRCCRVARWVSVAALAAIAIIHASELHGA